MPETPSNPDLLPTRHRALPVTITPGMPVVEIDAGEPGMIVGFTQAFCVYLISESDDECRYLAVAAATRAVLGEPPCRVGDGQCRGISGIIGDCRSLRRFLGYK